MLSKSFDLHLCSLSKVAHYVFFVIVIARTSCEDQLQNNVLVNERSCISRNATYDS